MEITKQRQTIVSVPVPAPASLDELVEAIRAAVDAGAKPNSRTWQLQQDPAHPGRQLLIVLEAEDPIHVQNGQLHGPSIIQA